MPKEPVITAETELSKAPRKPRTPGPRRPTPNRIKEGALLLSFEDRIELIKLLKHSLEETVSKRKIEVLDAEKKLSDL